MERKSGYGSHMATALQIRKILVVSAHCVVCAVVISLTIINYLLLYSQVLKVCRTPGPTACSRTKMLQLTKVCMKS